MRSAPELDSRLEQLSNECDAWLRAFVGRVGPDDATFSGMLRYPLGWVDADLQPLDPDVAAVVGGKRLRPALCLLIAEAVGADWHLALPAAAAVELIHNFSLVHDDIQDESPLRRGRPTVWSLWGAAQAINVGDGLYSLAQLALVEAGQRQPQLLVDATRRLHHTCLRLVEGQYLDLAFQHGGRATQEAYQTMISGKTAALIEFAAWLGAVFGGAPPAVIAKLASFGRLLGLAFQYQDDLLGIWGDPALTGKSADTDLRTRKQALPAVLALQAKGRAAAEFRALFVAEGELSDANAARALALLDELDVRSQAEQMVATGYAEAEAALIAAIGRSPDSAISALLDRFRSRRA